MNKNLISPTKKTLNNATSSHRWSPVSFLLSKFIIFFLFTPIRWHKREKKIPTTPIVVSIINEISWNDFISYSIAHFFPIANPLSRVLMLAHFQFHSPSAHSNRYHPKNNSEASPCFFYFFFLRNFNEFLVLQSLAGVCSVDTTIYIGSCPVNLFCF